MMGVLTACVLTIGQSNADPEAAFAQGLAARADVVLARRHFAEAARGYDARWSSAPSVEVAIRRGQAHALAGNRAEAIVAWRQGLRIDSSNPTLQDLLRDARRRADVMPTTVGIAPWPAWLASVAWGTYALGWLLLAWRGRKLAIGLIVAGVVGAIALAVERSRRESELARPFAVVRDGPPEMRELRQGNGPSYPALADTPLPVGTEVWLRFQRRGWWQVECSDGQVGWLPDAALTRLEH